MFDRKQNIVNLKAPPLAQIKYFTYNCAHAVVLIAIVFPLVFYVATPCDPSLHTDGSIGCSSINCP